MQQHPATTRPARIARPVRVVAALMTLVIVLGVWGGVRTLTTYENTGIVTTLPPVNAPIVPGKAVGVQVFLDKEVDPANIRRTAETLKEGGVTNVRQSFSWCELETTGRGVFWDARNNKPSWQKYDQIVDILTANGIAIMARLDNAPAWSRPGKPGDQCQKGPPTDLNAYADFVREVTTHYRGRLAAVQIWNEPNLSEEWGGDLNVVQYTDMLKRAYQAAKQGDPDVRVVTAAMAPTNATPPVGISDLAFYEQMYQAGAKGSFDVLAVNVYGLGEPPDDRRLSADRFNVSRPILVHDIMTRYGDTTTPVWTTEFGYNSLPRGWNGEPSIWGPNVDEQTQARYLVGGLTRMREEWPWMGTVYIWGFRWAERPGLFGKDPNNPVGPPKPEPYFALVNYDFTPRPSWNAVRQLARSQALRTGRTAATDPLIQPGPGWERSGNGASATLAASAPDALLAVPFTGTDLAVVGTGGTVAITVDGKDRGTVSLASGGNSVTRLTTNLPGGPHIVTLRAAGGTVRLGSFLVQRRAPFGWVLPLLTLGVILLGGGAIGTVIAETLGACDDRVRRNRTRRTAPMRGAAVR
ncbi:MAG: cellulase family glycosylhydrolase [Thermomicrobiales bacterium]